MSAVFYADEAQREAIERTRKLFVGEDQTVHTEVAPLDRFWIAEDYHQKYRLRHEPALYEELRAIYGEEADFVNSTASATGSFILVSTPFSCAQWSFCSAPTT